MAADAVFIIDEIYDSFREGWDALCGLVETASRNGPVLAEPLRISLNGSAAKTFGHSSRFAFSDVGWHFVCSAHDDNIQDLSGQLKTLIDRNIRFRVRGGEYGKHRSVEIRFNSGERPYLVLPFEDRVENTLRFFGNYVPHISKTFEQSEKKSKKLLQAFHEHCQAHFQTEAPMMVRLRTSLIGGRKYEMEWKPVTGKVGRHEIMTELRIFTRDNDPDILIRFLGNILEFTQNKVPNLYLQYFLSSSDPSPAALSDEKLLEMTFNYSSLLFSDAKQLIDSLKTVNLSGNVRDAFILIEQPNATLTSECGITYVLRRTRDHTYEVRMNTTWKDDSTEPEEAIIPFEKKTGVKCARIV